MIVLMFQSNTKKQSLNHTTQPVTTTAQPNLISYEPWIEAREAALQQQLNQQTINVQKLENMVYQKHHSKSNENLKKKINVPQRIY